MSKQQEERKKKKETLEEKNWPLVVLSTLILLTLIFLFYFYFTTKPESEVDMVYRDDVTYQEVSDDLIHSEDSLQGKIYLTLSPSEDINPNIYRLDLSSSELSPYFDDYQEEGFKRNYMSKLSLDGSKMVFWRWMKEPTPGQEESEEYDGIPRYTSDEYTQLVLLDRENQETTELSFLYNLITRNPQFSPDGELITYWISESEHSAVVPELSPELYSIHVLTLDGIKQELTNGVHPKFLPDGEHILFLKDDGLYTINLDTNEERLVLDMAFGDLGDPFEERVEDTTHWSSVRFNFSSVNNLLIVTDQLRSKGKIYEISSWNPLNLDFKYEIELYRPSCLVFSPCGEYFAITEFGPPVEESEFDQGITAQVAIYALETFERKQTFSLEEYYSRTIWISDWVLE